jgi:hypothetical protein
MASSHAGHGSFRPGLPSALAPLLGAGAFHIRYKLIHRPQRVWTIWRNPPLGGDVVKAATPIPPGNPPGVATASRSRLRRQFRVSPALLSEWCPSPNLHHVCVDHQPHPPVLMRSLRARNILLDYGKP